MKKGYKKENGIYPENIDNFKFKTTKIPFYKYVSESGNQNYLLYVSKDELMKTNNDDEYKSYSNSHFFKYCSDKNKCEIQILIKLGIGMNGNRSWTN